MIGGSAGMLSWPHFWTIRSTSATISCRSAGSCCLEMSTQVASFVKSLGVQFGKQLENLPRLARRHAQQAVGEQACDINRRVCRSEQIISGAAQNMVLVFETRNLVLVLCGG